MKFALGRLAARFDALDARERLLVFAAALAAVGFAVQALMIEPALRESTRLRDQLAQQEKVLTALTAANQSLLAARSDPDAAARARIEQGKRELEELTQRMGTIVAALVPADRMPALLQSLLDHEPRLSVMELKSLALAPLTAKPTPPSPADAADADGMFKHGIELTAQGTYGDLYRYVARLERGPFQMYWSGATLDASAYPRGRLTLRLYTVSADRSWMRL